MERFVQAFVAWSRAQLKASKATIFDKAFHFLEERQIQASAQRVAQRREDGQRYPNRQSRKDSDDKMKDTLEPLDVTEDVEYVGSSSYRSQKGTPISPATTDDEDAHPVAQLHAWGGQGWSVANRSSGMSGNDTIKTSDPSCFPRPPSPTFRSLQPKRPNMRSPSETDCDKERATHGRERDGPVNEGRKRRQQGALRMDSSVFVKKVSTESSHVCDIELKQQTIRVQ